MCLPCDTGRTRRSRPYRPDEEGIETVGAKNFSPLLPSDVMQYRVDGYVEKEMPEPEKRMKNFSIQSVGNQAVITVDLSLISMESLNRLFERLQTEELIQQAGFDDNLVEIGGEIKRSWWRKNREWYLQGALDADRD